MTVIDAVGFSAPKIERPVPEKRCVVSVVTPTFKRPAEIAELLANLSEQKLLPDEVILIDGSPSNDCETAEVVERFHDNLPFRVRYLRSERGTAVQRNHGIGVANGTFVALIDDDVRLERDFLFEAIKVFDADKQLEIGGVVGYRTNRYFPKNSHVRWRWYKRLGLLTTFEPGRYDFETGYPINNNMQPIFNGVRNVDFMTTACGVWRREVFSSGLRFDPHFSGYGVLEDAHFSLLAGKKWKLVQCGDAKCQELKSPNGRSDEMEIGYKCVVNYLYVFNDVAGPLSIAQRIRFWRFQLFELCRVGASALTRRRIGDLREVLGRLLGIYALVRGVSKYETTSPSGNRRLKTSKYYFDK